MAKKLPPVHPGEILPDTVSRKCVAAHLGRAGSSSTVGTWSVTGGAIERCGSTKVAVESILLRVDPAEPREDQQQAERDCSR